MKRPNTQLGWRGLLLLDDDDDDDDGIGSDRNPLETHNDWTIWIWLLIFPVEGSSEFSPKMDPLHSTKISPTGSWICEAKLEVSEEIDLFDTFFTFQSFREP